MAMKMKRYALANFGLAPNKQIARSKIITSPNHKTTFNAAELVPLHWKAVLPGDVIKGDIAYALRSNTPINPVMDNLFMNIWTFFIPNRILMDGWEKLQGENVDGKWKVGSKGTTGMVPKIAPPQSGWDVGSLAEKLGLPIGVNHSQVSHLLFRAYVKIYNEMFRDQNNQVPAFSNYDDNSLTQGVRADAGDPTANAWKGGALFKVNKPYDYFTYALPGPQKADDVLLPIGNVVPVTNKGEVYIRKNSGLTGLFFESNNTSGVFNGNATFDDVGGLSDTATLEDPNGNQVVDIRAGSIDGLEVDLSNVTGISVKELRELIALQHIFEGDARHGTRYFERLESIWGIRNEMARLDRPELLGKHIQILNMDQVAQTSSTDNISAQGNLAAYSLTSTHKKNYMDYLCKEHGYIITLGAIRQDHTYSYGIHKEFMKFERFDFFEPDLANLGEQEILSQEIYADGSSQDTDIFGYRPAWDEYRHDISYVSGLFRPKLGTSGLSNWVYADKFDTRPILGTDFIQENDLNVDRSLAIKGSVKDQFKIDFMISYDSDRPIPMNSIPGLERI